jgi:hypothetical protein
LRLAQKIATKYYSNSRSPVGLRGDEASIAGLKRWLKDSELHRESELGLEKGEPNGLVKILVERREQAMIGAI